MTIREEFIIRDRAGLRALADSPMEASASKVIDHIDPICRRYIAAAAFVVVATKGVDGLIDLSPKGDPAGFVGVLDDKTLAIPERPGNHRMDTYENVLIDPSVGLIFIIPGHNDTLRVSGKARISRDPELCKRFALRGRAPKFLLLVTVEEAFTHCPKCMIRASMWRPENWPDRSDVPTLAEAMVTHGRLSRSVADMQAAIDDDRETNLY